MKIFVTGATGFIGSHFINAALAAGHEIVALRRSPVADFRVALQVSAAERAARGALRWVEKTLPEVVPVDLKGCAVLVHLAAAGVTPQPADWECCYRVNVVETLALVNVALAADVSRVVVAGSYAEYGLAGLRFDPIPPDAPLEPTDPYAASKASASIALSAMCRVRGFKLVYPRLFSVFGEGQYEKNFWPELRRAALAGEDFPMTAGDQIRDFIAVEDVAAWLITACTRDDVRAGRPLIANLASGEPVALSEFAARWWRHFDATGRLLVGAIPSRPNEVKRYVPLVESR